MPQSCGPGEKHDIFDRFLPLDDSPNEDTEGWFYRLTGEKPEKRKGLTVGMPLYNEAGDLENMLTQLLGQRRPEGIPYNLILVSNASTDGTPKMIKQYMDQLATQPGATITARIIMWPSPEFIDQYQREHWYGVKEGQIEQEEITIRELSTMDGLHIIHAHATHASKNNALNLIRHLSPTNRILSIDGDILLHDETITRLYGALAKQDGDERYPVVAGRHVPYYDRLTPFTLWRQFEMRKRRSHKGEQHQVWGGLFGYDRTTLPPFPVDLMCEDDWLTRHQTDKLTKVAQWVFAPTSLGGQRRPSTWRDARNEEIRFAMTHEQLLQLHPEVLPKDSTSLMNENAISLIRSYLLQGYPDETTESLRQQSNLIEFVNNWLLYADDLSLLRRVVRLARAAGYAEVRIAAQRRITALLKEHTWEDVKTFPRIGTSKG